MEKFTNLLIKEGKSVTFLCDEYDEKSKSVDDEYKPRLLGMIYSILNNYFKYGSDELMNDDEIDFKEDVIVEIDVISLGRVDYIKQNRENDYVLSTSNIDKYDNIMDEDSNMSHLSTDQLSELLRGILNIPELIKYYSVSTIKKINKQ